MEKNGRYGNNSILTSRGDFNVGTRTIMNTSLLLLVAIGCCVGFISGLVGIGGGIIMVPALMFIAGFPQLTATGTSLAVLVVPVGLAAVIQYYRGGNVDIRAAIIIAITFFFCAWGGSFLARKINPISLRMGFGVLTVVIGGYIIFTAWKMTK
jgi:uncharacterized membrane protein YfcA